MLHADEARGTRSVFVKFPDGWRRDAVGNQPAGEEMVILSGALTISGQTAGVGEYLVVEPRATRVGDLGADGTSAVVFFSGPGGGWADGDGRRCRVASRSLTVAAWRDPRGAPRPGRQQSVAPTSPARSSTHDVEIVWPPPVATPTSRRARLSRTSPGPPWSATWAE